MEKCAMLLFVVVVIIGCNVQFVVGGRPAQRVTACEWGAATEISCTDGDAIVIEKAMYGRQDKTTCAMHGIKVDNTDCSSLVALEQTREKCENQKSCLLEASNTVFGDPCQGIRKYLQVTYSCRHPACKVPGNERVDCGWPGITQEECEAGDCCFDSSTAGTVWCFNKRRFSGLTAIVLKSSRLTQAKNGNWYQLMRGPRDFAEAKSKCESQGAQLVCEGWRDPAVRSWLITSLLAGESFNVWIGLQRVQSTDRWKWIDGVSASGDDTYWGAGQPSNSREECGEIIPEIGWKANDVPCDYRLPLSICEWVV